MCGIAGIFKQDGSRPDEGLLKRMADALAHRGPDGEGVWTAPGIGLAHRRLAIIDLSERGAQPMLSHDGNFVIVYNGEIYNYRELKNQLKANWKSDSDTEVILEGYRAWGDEVVKKLRGMFAFSLWDVKKQKLLLARDRIGKKPLFFSRQQNGDLVFASEIKALRGEVELKPDFQDIRLFLGLQYIPSPRTGFQNVQQLEPGCLGIWEAGKWRVERYNEWSKVSSEQCAVSSEEEIDNEILAKLDEAVKIRQLAADVSVGAFLSGGVDSAAIVALASKHSDKPLQTFTMGFPNLHMDERKEAREIAELFNTDHQEFEARPEHLMALIDKLVTHYDAPYADSSALPLWLLAREASHEIKVVLTGDGGDETFGGYRRYAAFELALQLGHVPFSDALLHATCFMLHDTRCERLADTVEAIHKKPETAYGELFCGSYFNTKFVNELCTPDFLHETNASDAVQFVSSVIASAAQQSFERSPRPSGPRDDMLEQAMFFDLTSYLPDDLNVKMDRATMAFGLEARAPFLDQELVAFSLGLPLNQKVSHGKTKIALRRALSKLLPETVLERPKRGFQVPLAEWFRTDIKSIFIERCLSKDSPLESVMRTDAIKNLLDENTKGADHGNRLWMLLSLTTWLKRFV